MSLAVPSQIFLREQQSFNHALMKQNYTTCLMCNNNFKNLKLRFADCQHDFQICKECSSKHIEQKMQALEPLTCPCCPAQMLMQSGICSTIFENLSWSKKKEVKQYVEESKSEIKAWICTVNNCGGRIPNEICQKCSQHYCPKCKQKQHPLDSCPSSQRTSTSSDPSPKTILKCPRCGYLNQLNRANNQKKNKIRCGNQYCEVGLCLEHKAIWGPNHESYHPLEDKLLKKEVGCASCQIF